MNSEDYNKQYNLPIEIYKNQNLFENLKDRNFVRYQHINLNTWPGKWAIDKVNEPLQLDSKNGILLFQENRNIIVKHHPSKHFNKAIINICPPRFK